ncbi:MAG: right-handed parallel beta-helix repeat-containing protein [Krumholzibacteria bacterium]|nr:right-handed parallel beta-helix repeat-containing protein [Candidatus Krumholzibacteria bacterium]
MRFENLKFGVVAGDGVIFVDDSRFIFGGTGLSLQDPASCTVLNSAFDGIDESSTAGIAVWRAAEAEISNCTFDNARIYFDSSPRTVVSDCTVTSGELVSYYRSGGEVLRSVADCIGGSYGIAISECDTIRIEDSTIIGGLRNVTAGGAGTVLIAERNVFRDPTYRTNFDIGYEVTIIAHDNDIYAGAGMPYVVEVCCYPVGTSATIDFGNNYWGEHSNTAALDSLIYDGDDDPNIHVIVNYEPIRTESVPVEKKSLGGLKALFLGR